MFVFWCVCRFYFQVSFQPADMSFPGGKLSVGSIADVVLRAYTQPVVVQVIEVKKVSPAPGSNASERFRFVLSF